MPHKMNEFCDLDGKLAVLRWTHAHRDRPVQVYEYEVFTETRAVQYGEPHYLIGKRVTWNTGGRGTTGTPGGGTLYVDTTDCKIVTREVPIPKPRDGKEYTWIWTASGFGGPGWSRESFPKCAICGDYHNPAYIACALCGRCHREGAKCKPSTCWTCDQPFAPDGINYTCPRCRERESEATLAATA